MLTAGVLAVAGILGLYLLHRYASRPYTWKVPVSDLRSSLETLLRRGYDGSFVLIKEPGTERFVQFAKYIRARGDFGLELGFPRTTWSGEYYSKLENLLVHEGTVFRRRPVATDPTTEFLEVDCGKDTELAFRIAYTILTTIFQIPLSTRLRVRFSNLSLTDELIDTR
jgi:hypothetical protein